MAHENSLAEAVAGQLRELRGKRTWRLDDVATFARRYGLNWDASTVAKIERGERSAIGLDELIALTFALDVRLTDWIPDSGDIEIRPGLKLPAHTVRALLAGGPSRSPAAPVIGLDDPANETRLQAMEREAHGQAEQKAAVALTKRLGHHVYPIDVVDAAWRLWDMSLTRRRDEEVAALPASNLRSKQATRGHVTRRLQGELETLLKKKEKKR